MSNCFEDVKVEDLDLCVNEELAAGTSETEVYAAVSEHINIMPQLPSLSGGPTLSLESLAKITEDITFNDPTNQGFFKIQAQVETGEVKDDMVGNKGNKKVKSSYDFFLPNTSARNIGFIRQYKNMPLVFLVKEKTGRIRLLGSKTNPVYLDDSSLTTGKGPEDDNGNQITVSNTSAYPAPIYEGNIHLLP